MVQIAMNHHELQDVKKNPQIGDSEEHGSDQFHHLLIGKATFRDSLAVVVLVEGQGSTKEDSY